MSKLNYGSAIHLQCMYDVARGDYLDLNNPINEQEYFVTTTISTARDGLSGTWRIEPTQSGQGSEIKIGDYVKICNAATGDKYLCAIPYSDPVFTVQAVSNRISTDESLQWEIYVPNGMKGDTLEESTVFYLLNRAQQAYLWVNYGGPAGTSNALYGVWAYKKFSAIAQMQWRALAANEIPAPTPAPTPVAQMGRQCCWEVPANTTVYINAMNTREWTRTVHVQIDGKEATPISLPTGNHSVAHIYKAAQNPPTGNKNSFCISIDDSQASQMMLKWYPPVTLGTGTFINIGADKDYQPETGYTDVAISVYWVR